MSRLARRTPPGPPVPTHYGLRPLRLAGLLAGGLLALSVAACSSAPVSPPGPVVTITSPHPAPPPVPVSSPDGAPVGGPYTISGTARTGGGQPVSGAVVGFRLTTATCANCDFYSAVTAVDGSYRVSLPGGTYLAGCVDAGRTCEFDTVPTAKTQTFNVDADGTVNLLVAGPSGDDSTPPPPLPSSSHGSDDNSDTLTGHVRTGSGQPVAGATVEFRKVGCPDCMPQPWTTTNASGAYSIDLIGGVYNAECPEPDGCSAVGSNGGQFPVTMPRSSPVDFVVSS